MLDVCWHCFCSLPFSLLFSPSFLHSSSSALFLSGTSRATPTNQSWPAQRCCETWPPRKKRRGGASRYAKCAYLNSTQHHTVILHFSSQLPLSRVFSSQLPLSIASCAPSAKFTLRVTLHRPLRSVLRRRGMRRGRRRKRRSRRRRRRMSGGGGGRRRERRGRWQEQ